MAVVAIKFHVRFDGVAKDERVQYLASVWLYRLVSSVIRNKNVNASYRGLVDRIRSRNTDESRYLVSETCRSSTCVARDISVTLLSSGYSSFEI